MSGLTARAGSQSSMPWWAWPMLLMAIPIILVVFTAWQAWRLLLLAVVWLAWSPRGRVALVVYSSSPIWEAYFVDHLIPKLGIRATVLNWSDRTRWRVSLSVLLFNAFAGSRDFNPIAIVFRPFRWPQRYRFHQPFRAYKRGRHEDVDALTRKLVAAVTRVAA